MAVTRKAQKDKPTIQVDMTKPRDKRPLTGYDIHQWAGEFGLNKYKAANALGFRNANHYDEQCKKRGALDHEVEVLLRIYRDHPGPGAWHAIELKDLFDQMYGAYLAPFMTMPDTLTYAKVDLQTRFTKLFGRSGSRQYEWLEARDGERRSEPNMRMEALLCKLATFSDPGPILEKYARQVLALRGVKLDTEFPIPTPERPPKREKTGRPAKSIVKRTRKPRATSSKRAAPSADQKADGSASRSGARAASRTAATSAV
jgi:hypothetical protein